MIRPGLVSVTFRALAPRDIVDLVAEAGLWGIEWGGDVHVPTGDLATARAVRAMTLDAGIVVAAYGSYFRFGHDESFERVLETALELGAPVVRVWAGNRSSTEADDKYRDMIAEESRRIAALAADAGIAVAYEFHDNTLTDTTASTLALLDAAPGMQTLWQPPHTLSDDERIASLRAVLPRLAHIHAFSWTVQPRVRHPLAHGADLWTRILAVLAQSERDHAVLLEFVSDDEPEQFRRDAQTLRAWLAQASPPV